MKLFTLVISFFLLVGCASTYQKKGFTGGYEETQLAVDIFSVSFGGNGYTSGVRAQDFALLRSAELTLEHGYRYFVLINESNSVSTASTTMPSHTQTTGNVYGNSFDATSVTSGGQTINIRRPSSIITFRCFKEKPARSSFDAQFLYKSISTKYGIKNGETYQKEKGLTQEYKQSFKKYKKAAEKGDTDAQTSLGIMYHKGQGVTQNNKLAHMWLNIAASSGYKEAAERRDEVAKEMSPSQIEKAQDMAREWVAKQQN